MNGERVVFRIVSTSMEKSFRFLQWRHTTPFNPKPLWLARISSYTQPFSTEWRALLLLFALRMVGTQCLKKSSKFTRSSSAQCRNIGTRCSACAHCISVYAKSASIATTTKNRCRHMYSILSFRKLLTLLAQGQYIYSKGNGVNVRVVYSVHHFVSVLSHFGRCQILKTKHQYPRPSL